MHLRMSDRGRLRIGHTQNGWTLTLHAKVCPSGASWDETREPGYSSTEKKWSRLPRRVSSRPTLYVTEVGIGGIKGVELKGRLGRGRG